MADPGSSDALHSTRAIIVGIEEYAAGHGWELRGPRRDALRFAEWLRGRGMPRENMVLCLSPRGGAADDAPCRAATFEDIRDSFLTLADRGGSHLWVWWGGHGVLDDEEHLRLFCEEASVDDKRNFDLQDLCSTLATDQVPGFEVQTWIVDACQSLGDSLNFARTLPRDRLPKGRQSPRCDQRVFLAASRGQLAVNDPVRRTGLFSEAVLEELEALPAGSWPPLLSGVDEGVRKRLDALRADGRTDQVPSWLVMRSGPTSEYRQKAGSGPEPVSGPQPSGLREIVDGILELPGIEDPTVRQTVVSLLPKQLSARLHRLTSPRPDVASIVNGCSRSPADLWALVDALRTVLGTSDDTVRLETLVASMVGPEDQSGPRER